jgi:subtilisin family serine protease
MSNFGPSIGNRGLMAPGVNIRSTSLGARYAQISGTSFATQFIEYTENINKLKYVWILSSSN